LQDPLPKIEYYINHRKKREEEILGVLKEKGTKMSEMDLVKIIYTVSVFLVSLYHSISKQVQSKLPVNITLKMNLILGHTGKSAYCSSFKCKPSSVQVAEGEEGASVWLQVAIQRTRIQPMISNHLTREHASIFFHQTSKIFYAWNNDKPKFRYSYWNWIISKFEACTGINLPNQ
jgi:hypothetical protein